jgi:hypothetical protein
VTAVVFPRSTADDRDASAGRLTGTRSLKGISSGGYHLCKLDSRGLMWTLGSAACGLWMAAGAPAILGCTAALLRNAMMQDGMLGVRAWVHRVQATLPPFSFSSR